jgi:hypothetical protein
VPVFSQIKRIISYRLRVFENRMLMKMFMPKREKVTGDWRKLLSEELHNLYSPPIIRVNKPRRSTQRMKGREVHKEDTTGLNSTTWI